MTARVRGGVVRVGKKSQIVIPAAVRNEAGIEEGDRLRVTLDPRGRLMLTPVVSSSWERLRELGRDLFSGIDPVAMQRESRADGSDDDEPA